MDGQRTNTYGTGDLTVRIGNLDISLSVLVANIEDLSILGMEFLSVADTKIDLVQQQLVINGKEIGCWDENCQHLTLRCVIRRVATIEPHCETVTPVHQSANQGLRLLEPCAARLEEKCLYVG